MADHVLTTPEPRAAYYVRATQFLTVTLHQPVAPGQVRTIPGRVLGEMRVNGCVHHYRVVDGDGVLLLVPPGWVRLTGEDVRQLGAHGGRKPAVRAEVLA